MQFELFEFGDVKDCVSGYDLTCDGVTLSVLC